MGGETAASECTVVEGCWGGSEGGGAAGTGGREPNRIWKLFSDSRTDTTHKKTKTREETNIGSRGLILSEGREAETREKG